MKRWAIFILLAVVSAAQAAPPSAAIEVTPAETIVQTLMQHATDKENRVRCRLDDQGFALPETSSHVSLSNILFEIGKTDVSPQSIPQLDEVVKAIQTLLSNQPQDAFRILIEGHTCDIGAMEKNRRISEGRAESVQTYLRSKGIPGATLETRGWGEERPCTPNLTEIERRHNRRVDFVLRWHYPPTVATTAGPLLSVKIVARKESQGGAQEEFQDTANLKNGDAIKVSFSVLESCHVYVLGKGSSGTVQWFYPKQGADFAHYGLWCYFGSETVLPGPQEDQWYRLDPPAGAETIWVIASRTPLLKPKELSERLAALGADPAPGALQTAAESTDAEFHSLKITHE
jgi:outer membrane protein OmpA-like peptidoglycan-associated protein